MKHLYLEDLKDLNHFQVKKHILESYQADKSEVKKYDIIIAYESVGSWGCDSSSWFLLRDKETKELYETHGSHCSCYGFEGQFEPEKTSLEYLKSEHFHISTGGYDYNSDDNKKSVIEFISKMK